MNRKGCDKEVEKSKLFSADNKILSNIVKNYENSPIELKGLKENIVSEIPIILGRREINFSLNSIIKVLEGIEDIKSIHNKIIIDKMRFFKKADTLFVKGKVKKTINYFQRTNYTNRSSAVGNLKYFIVYIPFEISTIIELDKLENFNLQSYIDDIYFELISTKIIDKILLMDNESSSNYHNEDRSKLIKSIMNLFFQVDVMQNQFISVDSESCDLDYMKANAKDSLPTMDHGTIQKSDSSEMEDTDSIGIINPKDALGNSSKKSRKSGIIPFKNKKNLPTNSKQASVRGNRKSHVLIIFLLLFLLR